MDSQFYDNLQSAPDKDPVTGEIRYSGNNPYANQQNEPVSQQYPQQYMYQAGMGGYNPQMYQPSAAVPYIPYGAQNPGAGVYGYGGAVPVNQGYQGQIPGYQPGQYYGAPTQPGPVFQPAAPVYQGGYQQPASSQMYQQAIDANRMKAVNDENSRLRAELDEYPTEELPPRNSGARKPDTGSERQKRFLQN